MRLTTAIILLSMLQVSAASFGQNITYIKKDATLIQLFKEIKSQTGYNVVWSEESIDPTTRIDVNFRNTPLQEALDKSFKSLPLAYVINDKTIVIKEKTPSFRDKIVDYFTAIDVTGTVHDDKGNPLSGATVKLEGTNIVVRTNDKGSFTLNSKADNGVLIISFLGYKTEKVSFSPGKPEPFNIVLKQEEGGLQEVEIVSTGYQEIPKERATGSFVLVNNDLINRSVSTNILDRLDGVASSISFNNKDLGGNASKISIHGRSTLFSNANPLIILDGFPYDRSIDQINPSDIESISVLKDAAASSIWGSRSGNGVIVLTTKKGQKNQKMSIEISSTFTVGNKPNLYYTKQMSSAEFIDLEQYLFNKGFYTFLFSNPYNPISSAVDIFDQKKNNKISAADSSQRINSLKEYDVRSDISKYGYRTKTQVQTQFNIKGGTNNHWYYMSGGYDKNLDNRVSDTYERLTFSASNVVSLLKDRLQILGDFNFSSSKNDNNYSPYVPFSPYDRMADETGVSLPVVINYDGYRTSYVDTAGRGKLLDWHYRPKDELYNLYEFRSNQYRIKVGVNVDIIDGLKASINFQSLKENSNGRSNNDVNSYYTRNLINKFSSITDNNVNRVIPIGNILNENIEEFKSKNFRSQLSYNKIFQEKHEINAIVGYDGDDTRIIASLQDYYGYNEETLTNNNATINPLTEYGWYYEPFGASKIRTDPIQNGKININQSYYGNFSYAYKKRYIISGSARRDESNLFGVKTNQKGVPLWSAGIAWNLNQEKFYKLDWLSVLKIRISYGYNGNLDKTVSAYLTSNVDSDLNSWGGTYSRIINPPNPSLRWEKVKTWNFGIDYSLSGNNRISGSIDIYQKNAEDLIGNSPIAPQSGISQFKGNAANLKTKGIDVVLNSRNITGIFNWNTFFLLNYNSDKVTSYKAKQSSNYSIVNGNTQNPLEGYPYYSIFSFPSTGLDNSGAPQGYLNGIVSKDYVKIISILDPNQIKYNGSALPKYFGSIINTFTYRNFELSLNITYKFDYYFRRSRVFGGTNYGSAGGVIFQLSDFDKRWQKPGDEFKTIIPALTYPSNFAQDAFFQYSENLVQRADHIRFQDLKFSYNVSNARKLPFKKASLFLYARNLGILWRRNNLNINPDYTVGMPQPITGSLGINITL
ncbi:SusC/RagA family TonB-linked outer membrane protein [Pedobacter sp. B4-66]|uniref:SusC/RagA family TonB-linked outer membrane protein n=1 Tax=Pedobacter sp. B4-66 TaxID=2817280 RepID=UPI001BD91BBE|nr:SusC/RagA family TonB-linked outer membrane protein [Pedobacter sp. B4-66]